MLLKKCRCNHIIFGNGDIILPLDGIKWAASGDDNNFMLLWNDDALPTIKKILIANPDRFEKFYRQIYITYGRKIIKLISLKSSRFSVYESAIELTTTYIEFSTDAKNIKKQLISIIKFIG